MNAEAKNAMNDMDDSEPDDFEIIVIHPGNARSNSSSEVRPVAIVGDATKTIAMYSGVTPATLLSPTKGNPSGNVAMGGNALSAQSMNGIKSSDMQPSTSREARTLMNISPGTSANRNEPTGSSGNKRPTPSNDQIDGSKSCFTCAGVTLNSENVPDSSVFPRMSIDMGPKYCYRLRTKNSQDTSDCSEVSTVKTSAPGYPGAPSAVRITHSDEGAQIAWEPPEECENPNEIIEYAVYMAVKPSKERAKTIAETPLPPGVRTSTHLVFIRVYVGQFNYCTLSIAHLANAYIDTVSKPAIIFRITGRNAKGYGQATQVRWVQEISDNGLNILPTVPLLSRRIVNEGPKRLAVSIPKVTIFFEGTSAKPPRESGSRPLDV